MPSFPESLIAAVSLGLLVEWYRLRSRVCDP